MGRHLSSRPTAEAGPACLAPWALCRSCSYAPRLCRPRAEDGGRVAAAHRRRRTGGTPVGPTTPRAPALSRCRVTPLPHSSTSPSLLPAQAAATAVLAPPHAIAGVGVPATPDHRSSLHLRHAFAPASRSCCSSPFNVARLEPVAIAHRSTTDLTGAARLRGPPPSTPVLLLILRALAPPCPREPRARLPVPCRGRSRRTADEPRHRSTMRAVELPSELL